MAGPYPTTGNSGIVANVFLGMLQRLPDDGGYQYFLGELNGGQPLQLVANNITGTAEFQQKHGGQSSGEFVTMIYRAILGRDPELAGLAFWTAAIDSGSQTRGDVVTHVAASDEAFQKLAAKYPGGFYTS